MNEKKQKKAFFFHCHSVYMALSVFFPSAHTRESAVSLEFCFKHSFTFLFDRWCIFVVVFMAYVAVTDSFFYWFEIEIFNDFFCKQVWEWNRKIFTFFCRCTEIPFSSWNDLLRFFDHKTITQERLFNQNNENAVRIEGRKGNQRERRGSVGSNNNYIKYNKCLHMYENLWYLTSRVHRLSNLFAFGLARYDNALVYTYYSHNWISVVGEREESVVWGHYLLQEILKCDCNINF